MKKEKKKKEERNTIFLCLRTYHAITRNNNNNIKSTSHHATEPHLHMKIALSDFILNKIMLRKYLIFKTTHPLHEKTKRISVN